MALKQETIVMHRTDEQGNKVMQFPITNVENIEGISPGMLVDAGFIGTYGGNTIPEGWLPCDGAAVSRTTYAKLFVAIGTKYGAGNGSTTFNLPNMNNGSFLEGSNTAGTVKSAGLPNITGETGGSIDILEDKGAFATIEKLFYCYPGEDYAFTTKSFDASRCSSVYRNDITTVQPKSVTVKFCIKY